MTIPDPSPITNAVDDVFGYSKDAEKLLNEIIKNKDRSSQGAVTIGLIGAWGTGKTSYMNLMEEISKNYNNTIVIRINAWQNSGYDDIAKNLLRSIAENINDISITSTINNYAKVIADANISYISKFTSILFTNKKKQTEELFSKVSDKIASLNKLLIIQIDDLDRLTDEEILYTFKLIRNIADFKNTFFIVGFDYSYICNSLERMHYDDSFIEKIFNALYPLPVLRRNQQIDFIKGEINKSFYVDANINEITDAFMNAIGNDISLRNAKRLTTAVIYGIASLKDEDGEILVDLLDYMLINYLNIVNEKAYSYLANFKESSQFIKKDCIISNGSSYELNMKNENPTKAEKISEKEYLENRFSKNINDKNIELTYKIFKELFNLNRSGVARISYINYFPVFFERTFDKSLIKKSIFKQSIKNGGKQFFNDLIRWNDTYDKFSLSKLIAEYKCSSKEEWDEYLNAMLSITPSSAVDFLWKKFNERTEDFIPTPGLDLIKDYSHNSVTQKQTLAEALYTFLIDYKNLQDDTLEDICKKFSLLIFNKNEYLPFITKFNVSRPEITYKDIFKNYWDLYINKGGNYNSFDEDFWKEIEEFNFQDRIDLRNLAQDHIKRNIDEFIRKYNVESVFNDNYLNSLFKNYQVFENSAYSNNEWEANYYNFLQSIDNKTDELNNYIKLFEKKRN